MAAPSVSLVLGSGGARGLAHIGVIRWLEENGYDIQAIAGCSMGALVGGLHAAGRLNAYSDWLLAQSPRDLLGLIDLSFQRTGGLIAGERLGRILSELTGDLRIEDLPIRFTAVAANLENGREVWLTQGPLLDALRASFAIPMVFPPVAHRSGLLVDGGILNPVPIAPTLGDATDLTIAVHVSGELGRAAPAPQATAQAEPAADRGLRRLTGYLRRRGNEAVAVSWHMLGVANQAFDAMQSAIARQKMAAYPPDILVELPRNLCAMHEFHRAPEWIAAGYEAARRHIPARTSAAAS
ncbi:MAG: patatin-like phospholipase family protein [Pseudomonadota bacterium]